MSGYPRFQDLMDAALKLHTRWDHKQPLVTQFLMSPLLNIHTSHTKQTNRYKPGYTSIDTYSRY